MNRRRFLRNALVSGVGTITGWNQLVGGPILRRKLPKVDTEVHLWDLAWFQYPWLDKKPEFNRNFPIQSYLDDSHKSEISKIVFVESGVLPDFSIEEADWAIAWAKDYPILRGVIAQASLSDSVNFPRFLGLLEERPMIKGIRIPFQDALAQPFPFIKNMNRLARTDLVLEFSLAPERMAEVANLLRRCPAVPCVLGGLGNPDISGRGFRTWSAGIRAISDLPQVHCKISGILPGLGADWTLEQVQPYVDLAIDQFGFDRLMYGGDWPFFPQHTSYQDWSRTFEELIKPYSQKNQVKCCVENAERIYKL